MWLLCFFLNPHLRIYLVILERGKQREEGRERETHISMWKTIIDWLTSVRAPTRDEPASQACALTGNRTGNLSVCRLALNPLSHTGQSNTQCNYFETLPLCFLCSIHLLPFIVGWVVFLFMNILPLGVLGLFSVVGDYKKSCHEHLCTSFCMNICLHFLWVGGVEWVGYMTDVNFLRSCHTVFWYRCTASSVLGFRFLHVLATLGGVSLC